MGLGIHPFAWVPGKGFAGRALQLHVLRMNFVHEYVDVDVNVVVVAECTGILGWAGKCVGV